MKLRSRYLLGSISQTLTTDSPLISSDCKFWMCRLFNYLSIFSSASFLQISLILISPRAILYLACSNFMHYRACFFAGWSVLTAKWISFTACLIVSWVNLLFVIGWTHFSTIMLMISARVLDCCASLSLSVIWSYPRCKMISMISSLVLLGKYLLRSAFLATVPWEAFQKTQSVCKTSVTSFSTPFLQLSALLRQHAISKCLLLILQRMVATLVIFTFVEGCFSIILLLKCIIAGSLYTEPQTTLFQYPGLWPYYKIMLSCYFWLIMASTISASVQVLPAGFSYIKDIEPGIQIQPRYAIAGNFRGQVVQGYVKPTVIISTAAAYALKAVQSTLNDLGYRLVIYDAYRPQKAVDDLVAWSQQPEDNKTKQQFYPFIPKQSIIPDGYLAMKSGHSRGSTVDLTIIKSNKQVTEVKLIDYKLRDGRVIKVRDDGTEFMGGHFDLFDLSSHHDTLLVDEESLARRNLLREVMGKNGFRWLDTEWWHYTLKNEPFPTTYFDFNVE